MARARTLGTWLLATFAIFTAGFAVGKEVGVRRALERMPAPARALETATTEEGGPAHRLIVWYFHSTKRCTKCNTIEAYAKETIDTLFADQVAAGAITWQTANMDDIWNADSIRRYELIRSSLVLVEMLGDAEKDHTVLNRTWELTGDKETFVAFVESEVEMILDSWAEDSADDLGEE